CGCRCTSSRREPCGAPRGRAGRSPPRLFFHRRGTWWDDTWFSRTPLLRALYPGGYLVQLYPPGYNRCQPPRRPPARNGEEMSEELSGSVGAMVEGGDAATQAAERKILNRLRRAHGQPGAVIAAAESVAHCREVVQQLSADSKALDRAGVLVI